MKKGILFTIGITMLVTIVFSLALLLFHNTQSMENRFSELALLDRLSDLDGMIQNNIKDINTYESGLFITLGNNSVSFTESFPRTSRFTDAMTDYQDYIEENYNASPKITFDETKMSLIKDRELMYIRPHNILYEHHNGFPGESYKLEPSSNNVLEYNISIAVDAVSAAPGTEIKHDGSFTTNIRITTAGGLLLHAQEWKVDPDQTNTIEINLLNAQGAETGDINIQVGGSSYAYLEVDSEKTRTSTLDIKLQEPTNEPTEVKYSEDIFMINFEESKLLKKGTVKIA